ncbi:MAG: PilZ domain-containing protein [Candidatus Gastranaerophilales bacterium]|nr:PilZ domain-containing protein [Candidatus Gastranaerophilales bacterium]
MDTKENIADYIEKNVESFFPVGQKLSIIRTYLEDKEEYPSYVKDFDNDYMFIDILTKGGVNISVQPDREIGIDIITKDGIWQGSSVICDVVFSPISGIWVTYPTSLQRIQRRHFIRWEEFSFPAKLFIQDPEAGDFEEINTTAANISASGIAIYTKLKVPREVPLEVEFNFESIKVNIPVKYVHSQYDSTKKRYLSGFKFIGLSRMLKEQIHKKIIAMQIDYRKRGLI